MYAMLCALAIDLSSGNKIYISQLRHILNSLRRRHYTVCIDSMYISGFANAWAGCNAG